MDNKNFKHIYLIVALSVAVAGLIFMMIHCDIVNDIGSVMLVSGVYTVVDNFLLKKSLVDLVIQKVKLDKDIDSCGIVELGTALSDINYKELIPSAEKNIDIIHNYGRTWTTNNFDFIKKVVMEKNCDMRVILLNPNSLFVPALEKHYKYADGDLKKHIFDMTNKWKELYIQLENKKQACKKKSNSTYKNKKCGNIELYYFNGQPTNSLYRIDDKIIVVNSKTSNEKSGYLPYAVYENNGEHGIFSNYLKEIDAILKDSEKVDLTKEV